MAKASRSSIQGDLGRGEAFEIGTGDHPSVLKSSHKPLAAAIAAAWRSRCSIQGDLGRGEAFESSMAKASRSSIQGDLGRGEIGAGGHPSVLKSHKTMAAAIAAAWPSRCSIQGDLGRGQAFESSMAKASRSSIQGDLGRGDAFEIGTGGHPSVLKSHKTMAAAIAAAWPSRCSIQGDLGRGEAFESSMAKASSIQGDRGRGEAFEIGTGGHPSVLKSQKTMAAAWLKPAAAQSKEILGAGRPLRSGQGAVSFEIP